MNVYVAKDACSLVITTSKRHACAQEPEGREGCESVSTAVVEAVQVEIYQLLCNFLKHEKTKIISE